MNSVKKNDGGYNHERRKKNGGKRMAEIDTILVGGTENISETKTGRKTTRVKSGRSSYPNTTETGGNTDSPETNITQEIPKLSIISDIPAPAGKKSKKEDQNKTMAANISMLLQTGFGFAAKITNNSNWIVSNEESESIATPAAKILNKLGVSKQFDKYGDYVMLLTAVSLVVIPRVMSQPKELQEGKINGQSKTKSKKTKTETVNNQPSESSNSSTPDMGEAINKSRLDLVI